jgi:hypothetical protein
MTAKRKPKEKPRQSNIRRRPVPVGAVLPTDPDTPGSDPSPYPGLLDQVRTLIQDGMPSYATTPYGLVRQEQLSQQIPAVNSPTLMTFMVLFGSVALGKNDPVLAVPATIAAYIDGSTIPATIANNGVTADIDQNGNFTLSTAPQSSLLVTYGYQRLADGDLYQHLDIARSWLHDFETLDLVPDGMVPAITHYAASLACASLARKLRLPDVTAGDAKETLSAVAKGYQADADDFMKKAQQFRKDYWTSADEPLSPTAAITSVNYPVYQPFR